MRVMHEDLLGPEAIADPYTYYGRLREEDPIHWNPLYETWVLTRYDDVVWALRHPEVFSSEIFLRDPRPPLPPILETDQALYEFNTHYLSHWFLRRDAPDHLRMRRVVHAHFNPKYIAGRFRAIVQEVVHALLAEVEDRGRMEVLQDFAAPLPVLVIAQWLGLPQQDREFIRQLSRHLLALDQENPDRNQAVHHAITTLVAYITPLVEERLTSPREDLLSVLATGEKDGSLSRDEVLGNTLLLLVAGHQTTSRVPRRRSCAMMPRSSARPALRRRRSRSMGKPSAKGSGSCWSSRRRIGTPGSSPTRTSLISPVPPIPMWRLAVVSIIVWARTSPGWRAKRPFGPSRSGLLPSVWLQSGWNTKRC